MDSEESQTVENKPEDLPITPRTSRIAGSDRVLRSSRGSNEEYGVARISSYFPVRKNRKRTGDKDSFMFCKRQRRGDTILNAQVQTPLEPYPCSPNIDDCTEDNWLAEELTDFEEYISQYDEPSPLGYFDKLPVSLLNTVIEVVPVVRLVNMSLTSSSWLQIMKNYLDTKACSNRFVKEAKGFITDAGKEYTIEDPYHVYGLLIKSTTVCEPTSVRIDALIRFMQSSWTSVMDYNGWGRFLHTIASKWAYTECSKVIRAVLKMNKGEIEKMLRKTLVQDIGVDSDLEFKVRSTLRGLFLDSITGNEKEIMIERSFWLSVLLRTQHSIAAQGRMLMILYAYTVTDEETGRGAIGWRSLVDEAVSSWEDSETRIKPLSDAIYQLLLTKRINEPIFSWSENEVFNLVEEITTCPDPWSFDNFVMLLTHNVNMIPISLCARIRHGYQEEAGNIVNTIKTLLFRWGKEVNAILQTPLLYCMRTLSLSQRRTLLDSICEAHAKQCRDYYAMANFVGTQESLSNELQSQFIFSGVLLEMGILLRP